MKKLLPESMIFFEEIILLPTINHNRIIFKNTVLLGLPKCQKIKQKRALGLLITIQPPDFPM